ncbi:uncharacterized protein GGS22DRAFT_198786 [Annulohypoxylon maeteangense]|uniref:uncharacterized protein n=1 Tax=Annulohypoxylon maeteangense TaxID=1927788 RepID=UPI00200810D8|nr:uncharacterized protein GGS22DRAFT_198786 [Annulohypoxylon maeteangense]KAI0887559.1 hypothetical protein GGS22DRAFT_198786 [Annulohypoxylon maeteangense]
MDMQRVLIARDENLNDVIGYFMYKLLQDTVEHFTQRGTPNNSPSLDAEIQQYDRIMSTHVIDIPENPLDLSMSLWLSHFDRSAAWSRNLSEAGLFAVCDNFLNKHSSTSWGRSQFRDYFACLGIKCYLNDPNEPLQMGLEAILDKWEDSGPTYLAMFAAALIPGAFRKGFLDEWK